jgi:hypothetical protein
MQIKSSVSPFVIFKHRLEPQKFGLLNNSLYIARIEIRNQSFCYALLFELVACSKCYIALENKVIRSDCRVYGFLWHKGKVQVSRRKFDPGLDFKYDRHFVKHQSQVICYCYLLQIILFLATVCLMYGLHKSHNRVTKRVFLLHIY